MTIDTEIKSFENKPFRTFTRWGLILIVGGSVITIAGYGMGFFTNAAKVAHQEFSPEAMLKKYEWFKDASASIDKQSVNLDAYERNIKGYLSDYEGVKKMDWPRDDRQAYNQLRAEYQGMLQMYNSTVAEYNAQSNKFNWRSFDQTQGDAVAKTYEIRGEL